MTLVRYNGSAKRIAGLVGSLIETRTLSLDGGDVALVRFPSVPAAIRDWNLSVFDLEAVA